MAHPFGPGRQPFIVETMPVPAPIVALPRANVAHSSWLDQPGNQRWAVEPLLFLIWQVTFGWPGRN
jgi:hypothetical protein